MEVTFDPAKDARNIRKHGISLARAVDFDLGTAIVVVEDSQDYGEVRYLATGWLRDALYSLIFTETDTTLRAISLRPATTQEQEDYAEEY